MYQSGSPSVDLCVARTCCSAAEISEDSATIGASARILSATAPSVWPRDVAVAAPAWLAGAEARSAGRLPDSIGPRSPVPRKLDGIDLTSIRVEGSGRDMPGEGGGGAGLSEG
eukprot:scaffold116948_cov27-Tisochrysis_lutea.AAC.3